ncbi:hypothetical protein NX059_000900 [Plenodomus lindquistii]|nr:hypothetical protein NX059_000900 [Plenodomus lindquistii]
MSSSTSPNLSQEGRELLLSGASLPPGPPSTIAARPLTDVELAYAVMWDDYWDSLQWVVVWIPTVKAVPMNSGPTSDASAPSST